MAKNLTLQDCFFREYRKGNVAKANLIDSDFKDLVDQYYSGAINFAEYSRLFYKQALKLIINRLNAYPI